VLDPLLLFLELVGDAAIFLDLLHRDAIVLELPIELVGLRLEVELLPDQKAERPHDEDREENVLEGARALELDGRRLPPGGFLPGDGEQIDLDHRSPTLLSARPTARSRTRRALETIGRELSVVNRHLLEGIEHLDVRLEPLAEVGREVGRPRASARENHERDGIPRRKSP